VRRKKQCYIIIKTLLHKSHDHLYPINQPTYKRKAAATRATADRIEPTTLVAAPVYWSGIPDGYGELLCVVMYSGLTDTDGVSHGVVTGYGETCGYPLLTGVSQGVVTGYGETDGYPLTTGVSHGVVSGYGETDGYPLTTGVSQGVVSGYGETDGYIETGVTDE